jgi:hypothetical protein
MNERVEELAKEHGFIHTHMSVGEYNDALKKFEKFAEVIVKEVADKIECDYKYQTGNKERWHTAFEIACNLREEYGVE